MLAFDALGTDVQTTMKMVGARFAKVPRQRNVIIHWRGELCNEK